MKQLITLNGLRVSLTFFKYFKEVCRMDLNAENLFV